MILYLSWRSAKPVLCIHSGVVGLDDFLIHCICLLSPYTGWVNLFVVFFFFVETSRAAIGPCFPLYSQGASFPVHIFCISLLF